MCVELLGLLDEHNFGAQLLEPEAVSVEIALQGQDTDFHMKILITEDTGKFTARADVWINVSRLILSCGASRQ